MRFKRSDGGGLLVQYKKLVWLIFQHYYRSFVITWPSHPQSIIFFKLLGRHRPLIGLTVKSTVCTQVSTAKKKKKLAKIPKRDFQSSKPNCGSLQEVHLCCTCREAAQHSLIRPPSHLIVCMESDEALMQNPRQSANCSLCESCVLLVNRTSAGRQKSVGGGDRRM